MKANGLTIISIIVVTFLFLFTLLNGLGLSVSPGNLYDESFRQESYIHLQLVSILENKNELEEETHGDESSMCFCLKNNYPHEIKFYVYNKKHASVKQMLFFDKSSRSPPFHSALPKSF